MTLRDGLIALQFLCFGMETIDWVAGIISDSPDRWQHQMLALLWLVVVTQTIQDKPR